jgi:hypothetical protein
MPRLWTCALALLAAPATVVPQGPGGPFAYAPGTQQYRITTITNRTQDQSGGRAPFQFQVTTTQYVTLQVAHRASDTLGISLTIDSLRVASTLDALPPDTEGFRGATLTGTMSPQGHLYRFEAPAGTPPGKLTALYRAFKLFLVPLPSVPIAAGVTWSDSTVDHIDRQPFAITSTMVTTWRVAGDTVVAGQRGWRIERSAIVTTLGDGRQGTTPIHLEGDDTIRGMRYLTVSGVYAGGSATQNSQIQMSASAGGSDQSESAPIRQMIKTTVEPLSAFRTGA